MPFTSPTDTIVSTLTSQGRDLLARSLLGQVSFRLSGFKVGRAGYDMANPVLLDPATPLDPADSDLIDPVFPIPTTTIKPFVTIEQPYPNVVAAVCRLNRNEATYGLGELGVWARVLRVDPPADMTYTAGQDYMVALAHMPIMAKTDKQVFVFRVIICT